MKTVIYTSDSNGVLAVGDNNPLPVEFTSGSEDADGNLLVSMANTAKTASISNGASQSAEVDIESYTNVGLIFPNVFDGTSVTFLASATSGGTFRPVYDSAGNELTVTVQASRAVTDIPELAPFRYIKLRAGTASSPQTQNADRAINVILKA